LKLKSNHLNSNM